MKHRTSSFMAIATALLLILMLIAGGTAGAVDLTQERQEVVGKIDGLLADYDRAIASFKRLGDRTFQQNVDDFIAYARLALEQEQENARIVEGLMQPRRAVLSRLPELASHLQRMDAADREMQDTIRRGLAILQQQLDISHQLKSAWQAQDAPRWNGLIAQKNQLIPQFEALKAKLQTIVATQRGILTEAKTALQQAIASTPKPAPVNPIPPSLAAMLTSTADKLAPRPLPSNSPYLAVKTQNGAVQTQCSLFVRDFAKEVVGRPLPELDGNAAVQIATLTNLAKQKDSGWKHLDFSGDKRAKAEAFQKAQELANQGKLVIFTWKNPKPTGTNSGHVAVGVPSVDEKSGKPTLFRAGEKTRSGNPGWDMPVPYVAQAGNTVSSKMTLSEGFSPSMKDGLQIFVYDR